MTTVRWNDDRLDDMARTLEKLETESQSTRNLVAVHDLQIMEIVREKKQKSDHGFEVRLMLAATLLGQLGTIIALVLTVR